MTARKRHARNYDRTKTFCGRPLVGRARRQQVSIEETTCLVCLKEWFYHSLAPLYHAAAEQAEAAYTTERIKYERRLMRRKLRAAGIKPVD